MATCRKRCSTLTLSGEWGREIAKQGVRQVEGVGAVVGCASAGLRRPAGPTCCVAVHAPVAPGVPVAALRCLPALIAAYCSCSLSSCPAGRLTRIPSRSWRSWERESLGWCTRPSGEPACVATQCACSAIVVPAAPIRGWRNSIHTTTMVWICRAAPLPARVQVRHPGCCQDPEGLQ